jgi:putative membrane protein
MRVRDYPIGAGVIGIIALAGSFDMLLEGISLVERYPDAAAGIDLSWRVDAWVVLPILFFALLYALGLRRTAAAGERGAPLRHASFLLGLLVLYLVLESPFDAISDNLFVAHQLQHMTLSMVVPILVILPAPQAMLLRGLPAAARHRLLAPFLRSRAFRVLRLLAHPAVATALYIAANYFWMVPHIHDAAIENERIHDLMHLTLLLAGLVFFWRILDPRPHPVGPSLGARLAMFVLAALAEILLGSFLAFKSVVLYHAYGPSPHLFGIPALDDESYGGLTMWIPGAGMLAFATMLTIRRFAAEEERRDRQRPAAPAAPPTERLARQRAANRKMALGLAAFAGSVLALSLMVVAFYHYAANHALLARL